MVAFQSTDPQPHRAAADELHAHALSLYARGSVGDAAAYFAKAAQTGFYPEDYKQAIDLYYAMHRYDTACELASQLLKHDDERLCEWASYMLFEVRLEEWEQYNMKEPQIENEWKVAAEEYVRRYPHSTHSFEAYYRIGEFFERKEHFSLAIAEYDKVTSNNYYIMTARLRAAACYIHLINRANQSGTKELNSHRLRDNAIASLDEAFDLIPSLPRSQLGVRATTREPALQMLEQLAETEDRPNVAAALWSRIADLSEPPESVWYEAQLNLAKGYFLAGNTFAACNQLGSIRNEHPDLGTADIRQRWDKLQRACIPPRQDHMDGRLQTSGMK
ncbi:MAG TPA: tetratricopeptide repeat protein [Candidatus Binataceae bacterium]